MKNKFKLEDKYLLTTFLVSIIAVAVLIAIPGYYSNDELVFLSPTATFLSPTGGMNTPAAVVNRCVQLAFNLDCLHHSRFFRPIGGYILTKIMRGNPYPFWPHLLMGVLHSINAVLLYVLLKRSSRNLALLTAIIFAASPLALYTVAWVAAIYDILMTMAGLAMALAICSHVRSGSKHSLLLVALFTSLGLLSKETALVFPAVALLTIYLSSLSVPPKRATLTLAAVILPWITYLAVRLKPLMQAAASSPGGYKTDIGSNVIKNMAAYAEFPFAFNLAEITNVTLLPNIFALLSALAFFFVFGLSWLASDKLKAIAFIGLWIAPLLPVLVITKFETQYLYGAAVGFSMALAVCLLAKNKWIKFSAILFITILAVHSFTIEKSMYKTGQCQTSLINQFDFLQHMQQGWPPRVAVTEKSPGWVLARLLGKWSYWHDSQPPVIAENSHADLIMTNTCYLQPIGNRN